MENNEKVIKVLDFTDLPLVRERTDGVHSAQEFFEDKVEPILDDSSVTKITIDCDGTWGVGTSFRSELAKRMSDKYHSDTEIRSRIEIKSEDEPSLIERFWIEYETGKRP